MIDAYASLPNYLEHIMPIWKALGQPGIFFCADRSVPHLRARGVERIVPGNIRGGQGPILVASWDDLASHRRWPCAFLEHGAGQVYLDDNNEAYSGGRYRESVGLFLCPNAEVAERNLRAYPNARAEVVGCPKLDDAPTGPPPADPPTVAISFHFDGGVAPEARSAFKHYAEALKALAKDSPWKLLGHAHPRAWSRIGPWWAEVGVEATPDFSEVLRRAHLYVVDNSSTGPEFASTGRPIVWLSAPWYRREVHHGGRFWEWVPAGEHVEDPSDLRDGIARALLDPPWRRALREEMVARVYAYRGDCAERAARAIRSWIEENGWATHTGRVPRPRGRDR